VCACQRKGCTCVLMCMDSVGQQTVMESASVAGVVKVGFVFEFIFTASLVEFKQDKVG
jgi:hypothetical protein